MDVDMQDLTHHAESTEDDSAASRPIAPVTMNEGKWSSTRPLIQTHHNWTKRRVAQTIDRVCRSKRSMKAKVIETTWLSIQAHRERTQREVAQVVDRLRQGKQWLQTKVMGTTWPGIQAHDN